ncbi:MAG TPA: hypothetical protein VGM56_06030 [Byssovorax sp.]|jgi:hypothetical protein
MTLTLETLLCSASGFGLTTASPVQRAVCRIVDGLPLGELGENADVRAAVGDVDALPNVRPAEVYLLAAIRSAKSMIAAAAALRVSQDCDVSALKAGETPRVSIVSLTTDLAGVVFGHLVGTVQARPALRALLVGEPTADSVLLRHPSGRACEVKVVAGARAGASLVARWSAGVIFDEAPRMNGSDDGSVVNFDDARRAVLGRLLPGAQLIAIGSPWAPTGPIYNVVQEHEGKPSAHVVVIRATGPAMNPTHWTAERCAELRERDAQAYRTDVLGQFADPESSLFTDDDLKAVTRPEPVELPYLGGFYYAAQDAATRSNAWTLVIATSDGARVRIVLARQWMPRRDQRLSPSVVLGEIATLCAAYRVDVVHSDAWSADALTDIARDKGLHLETRQRTTQERVELFESLRTLVAQGLVELPPVEALRADLLSVRKRVTQRAVSIELPRTGDGRHADFAPSVALAVKLAKAGDAFAEPDPHLEELAREAIAACGWGSRCG